MSIIVKKHTGLIVKKHTGFKAKFTHLPEYTKILGEGVKKFFKACETNERLLFRTTSSMLSVYGVALAGGYLRDLRTRVDGRFSDIDVFVAVSQTAMERILETLHNKPEAFLSIGLKRNEDSPENPTVIMILHERQTHDAFNAYTLQLLCILDPVINDDYKNTRAKFVSFRGRKAQSHEDTDEQLNIIIQEIETFGEGYDRRGGTAKLISTLFRAFPCSLSRVAMGLFPATDIITSKSFDKSVATGEVTWFNNEHLEQPNYFRKIKAKYPEEAGGLPLIHKKWAHVDNLNSDGDRFGDVWDTSKIRLF